MQSAAMSKQTVIKVNICCDTGKSEVLKVVTTLTGIDEVSVDSKKGTLTVKGEVDPALVINKLRKLKIRKAAEIVTVGPLKPTETNNPGGDKPKPPKTNNTGWEKPSNPTGPVGVVTPVCCVPACCNGCQYVAHGYVYYPYDDRMICSIL